MSKVIFSTIFIFLLGCHNSSSTSIDTSLPSLDTISDKINFLKEFSYHVVLTYKGMAVSGGTCFFYKRNNDTMLISNYHVLTGYDPRTKKKRFDVDSIILIPHDDIGENKFIPSMAVDKSLLNLNTIGQLDCIQVKVNWNRQTPINFINRLIDTNYFYKIPSNVYVFGYPTDSSNIFTSVELFQSNFINDCTSYLFKKNKLLPIADTKKDVNEAIKYRNKNFFLTNNMLRRGFSGSPVFGKFLNDHNKVVYKYIGIVSEVDSFLNITWIIKPQLTIPK